jgi:hypothetical protein
MVALRLRHGIRAIVPRVRKGAIGQCRRIEIIGVAAPGQPWSCPLRPPGEPGRLPDRRPARASDIAQHAEGPGPDSECPESIEDRRHRAVELEDIVAADPAEDGYPPIRDIVRKGTVDPA